MTPRALLGVVLLAALPGCVGDDLTLPDPDGATGAHADGPALVIRFLSAATTLDRTVSWEVADPDGAEVAGATWTIAPGASRDAGVVMARAGTYRVVVSDEDLGGKSEMRVDAGECGGRGVYVEVYVPESGEPHESDRACA